MTALNPLFDINQLTTEQQTKFHTVYNELKTNHTSYLQYKLNLQLQTKMDNEEEENEWSYELHRHLRARKWNIAHTIKSIRDMIQWRIDNHVDSILEHLPTSLRMDHLRRIVPSANHGYTKAHRPLYIEKSGQMHVDKILNWFTTEELLQCHIYWLEFNCQLARQRSRQVGKHVETFAMISDLNGCKPEIRKVLHLFKQFLYIDDTYYPERLGQMFVVNPPLIFPALWNLVKHWLDPVTKAKIIVIKKGPETSTSLLQYIDFDQLPHEYGGSCPSCPTSPGCIPVYDWSKDTADDKRDEQ
ncbi:unnamed protein product [Didymodactylos carnosus]|uniref:CRAL-TRIO domain-containing protein n=1 Tax=Didymodactylos carnosus TaxID=1234261 RepID=A0A814NFW2_9BILA|nr:unnamed protein product [Didymodactylos carnosus]CAF1091589.1 unnamed protein product [Didymodactylos carnosus]CAF3553319.1 unnamed protein product [Didymodactylos carnosus]CAF3857037.1 unnamed protein product [Didymodactylos carnosus]